MGKETSQCESVKFPWEMKYTPPKKKSHKTAFYIATDAQKRKTARLSIQKHHVDQRVTASLCSYNCKMFAITALQM